MIELIELTFTELTDYLLIHYSYKLRLNCKKVVVQYKEEIGKLFFLCFKIKFFQQRLALKTDVRTETIPSTWKFNTCLRLD